MDKGIISVIRHFSFWVVLLASSSGLQDASAAPLPPTALRCEYQGDPAFVDVSNPRFSWVLEHTERGQKQTAYQLIVAEDRSGRPVTWDSGEVKSERSTLVRYAGPALESNRSYFWKVRYRDSRGHPSEYSRMARLETGLLSAVDWKAKWIRGSRQFRREFEIPQKVVRARAFVSGLGYYELRLNGGKVGDHVLDPGWTTYEKRVLYSGYDIGHLLRPGKNSLAVTLGQGWYGSSPGGAEWKCKDCRLFLLQVEVELEGGEEVVVVSDESWKTAAGPTISDHLFDGEVYDARLETPGWDRPGFDDNGWSSAEEVPGPGGTLSAQAMPPIRVLDTIVPLSISNPREGVYVFDLGQNLTGWAQLRVKGPRGTRVGLRFAELLYPDGNLNVENLRAARAQDHYILKGEGEEVWEPRFTYHGFRYIELTGFPGVPTLESIRGRLVHSAVGQAGNFSSSNPVLNQIQRIILWGQKTNLHSIPTDCPQRDERMGWMGDAHVTAEEAILNFDMAAFLSNFVRNIRDVQGDDGTVTDTVPHRYGSRPADPAWGTAYPLLCWYIYLYYGDERVLEENYDNLRRYVEYLDSRTEEGIVGYSYYGDWVAIDKPPGSLVSTFYYYYDVSILARIARILGRDADAGRYEVQAEEIKKAFNQKFLDTGTGYYLNGSQTSQALPLFLDMVPDNMRGAVARRLQNDIVYTHNTHVTTGFIGVKYLMEVLTALNRSDLAYELASQTTYPSWGYMVEQGATTLWELWQNKVGPSMNSHNHPMFGSVGAWFYKALAGIAPVEESPGFRKIRIAPQVVRDLRYVSASTWTERGQIAANWSVSAEDGSLRLDIEVPVNSEADVFLPPRGRREIQVGEGDKVIWQEGRYYPGPVGILNAEQAGEGIVVSVGSGRYRFLVTGD